MSKVAVPQVLQQLFLRLNKTKFEWLDRLTLYAHHMMMVVRAIAVHDFVVSHVIVEITFLDQTEISEDRQRSVDRHWIALTF